jgi:predicted DNA-binding transcriptional regulator AlpA
LILQRKGFGVIQQETHVRVGIQRYMSDRLLDIQDLANRLKIPEKTIRNKLSNGTWPISPVRIGRALRWRESDVATAIAGLSSGRENSRLRRGR